MATLTDYGFIENTIYETIVSTYNPDGSPNAAPMGATVQTPQTLTLTIYNNSRTHRNLTAQKAAAINLTGNIEHFYKTTFKEANPNGQLPNDWFQKIAMVAAPKLRSANATIVVTVIGMLPVDNGKTKFVCRVEHLEGDVLYPQAYCRAFGLTLEAIIHATRVKQFGKDASQQTRIDKLLVLIQNSDGLVRRVAPNSVYSIVMADLMKRLDSWRLGQ